MNQIPTPLLLLCASSLLAAEPAPFRPTDVSFQHEVQRAIQKGNGFLKSAQHSNGWWSTPDHPSVTALALSALVGEPGARLKDSPSGCAQLRTKA